MGTTNDLETKYQAKEVIDANKRSIMPGFVNIHNHSFNLYTRSDHSYGRDKCNFGDVLTVGINVEDNNTMKLLIWECFTPEMVQRGITSADMLKEPM